MLEVQSFLQPERKIEILAKGEFDEKEDEVPSGPPQAGK